MLKSKRNVRVVPLSRQGAKQECSFFVAQPQPGAQLVERALMARAQGSKELTYRTKPVGARHSLQVPKGAFSGQRSRSNCIGDRWLKMHVPDHRLQLSSFA